MAPRGKAETALRSTNKQLASSAPMYVGTAAVGQDEAHRRCPLSLSQTQIRVGIIGRNKMGHGVAVDMNSSKAKGDQNIANFHSQPKYITAARFG